MKKFKIGEYIRIISTDEIVRIANISAVCIYHLYDTVLIYSEITDIEHLKVNIRFKPINIFFKANGNCEVWDCHRTGKGIGSTQFDCILEHNRFYVRLSPTHGMHVSTYVDTLGQAHAWLELEYVKMLINAKEAADETK